MLPFGLITVDRAMGPVNKWSPGPKVQCVNVNDRAAFEQFCINWERAALLDSVRDPGQFERFKEWLEREGIELRDDD